MPFGNDEDNWFETIKPVRSEFDPILPVGFGRAQEARFYGGGVLPAQEIMIDVASYLPKPDVSFAEMPRIGGFQPDLGFKPEPLYQEPARFFSERDEGIGFRTILTPEYDSPSIDLCVAPMETYAHTAYEPILPQGYERAQEVGYYGGGGVLPRQDLETLVSYQPRAEIGSAIDAIRDSGYGGGFKDFGSVQAYQPEPDVNFGMSFAPEPEPEVHFGYQPEQPDFGGGQSFMPTDPGISYERLPDPPGGMPDPMPEPLMPQPWETSVPDYGACGIIDPSGFMMDTF
jgi:hypothetical protein